MTFYKSKIMELKVNLKYKPKHDKTYGAHSWDGRTKMSFKKMEQTTLGLNNIEDDSA
jgi:hypothetical protein